MAQIESITYTSDLSGKDITDNDMPTVEFAIDGQTYEIDLTDAEQEKLRKALAPFIEAGRKAGTVKGSKKVSKKTDGPAAADIRSWAKDNGMDVPDRGRIPLEIKEAYMAASA